MKRILLLLTSALSAALLPGCLQNETTIHLNKDGSGTVVEQTTLGARMLAMMEQFAGAGADAKDPLAEMFSPEKAKAKAATMGEGVTFETSEPLTAAANKGARTTYRFTDINKLKISPGDGMKDMSPMGAQAAEASKQKPIAFTYAGGNLTITMPEPEKPAAGAPAGEASPDLAGNPEMEGMMKEMLADMKMSFKVVVEPGIAETDASHRDGNTITLMEMEMGKLLEKPETFKKLTAAGNNDPAAAMEALKGIEGVKMESKPKVTVKVD
jgi:hypothetical protein